MQKIIESAKEKKVDLDYFEVENQFFINLCKELKINPESCINQDNFGEIDIFGCKIITSLPILTSPGN